MELRHLRYFIAVAEAENITRAAFRLYVSQPSLSRQIRDFEDELGVALFEHSARSIKLTEAGRVFLPEARDVINRVQQAVETVRAGGDGSRGEIHVGFAPSLTVEILPKALRLFHETCPGTRVRLHDLSTEEMLAGLREKKLDVALMVKASTRALKGLVFDELRRFAVCVAAHPSHPLARAKMVSLKDIAQERLVAYTESDYPEYHRWLSRLFSRRPQIAEAHDGSTSLIAAVEAGRGVALVQQGFECFTDPRLIVRPLNPAPSPFIVGVAYGKGSRSASTMKFLSCLRKATGD